MNTKSIFTNIFIFFTVSFLYIFYFFIKDYNNNNKEPSIIYEFYDANGINQFGLDQQSMQFVIQGYLKGMNGEKLNSLLHDKEYHKLDLISEAYQFYDSYLLGFIRIKQECEFEGNNSINCQLYLTDKEVEDFKYKADLYCNSDKKCQLENFELLSTPFVKSEEKYYCRANFMLDSDTGMCVSQSEYAEIIINDMIKYSKE